MINKESIINKSIEARSEAFRLQTKEDLDWFIKVCESFKVPSESDRDRAAIFISHSYEWMPFISDILLLSMKKLDYCSFNSDVMNCTFIRNGEERIIRNDFENLMSIIRRIDSVNKRLDKAIGFEANDVQECKKRAAECADKLFPITGLKKVGNVTIIS